jgi:hypothetical protein
MEEKMNKVDAKIKQMMKNDYVALYSSLLPKNYSAMTEEELLAELRATPDFEKFVYPSHWYEKHDLPLKECMNMKEFLKEASWMKSSSHSYTGKIEVIEAKPGGNRPVLEAPEAPAITVVENHFSDATDQSETSHPPETQ